MADYPPSPSNRSTSQPAAGEAPDSSTQESARSLPGYGYGGYGSYGSYGRYGYGYGQDTTTGETHLLDYLRTLYRHRWTAVTTLIVILVAVTVYTFTITPVFEGRAQLLIEPENQNIVSFKEVVELDKATNEYYQTQYSILKSRALAKRTISSLGLWQLPEIGGGQAPASTRSWNPLTWLASSASDPSKSQQAATNETTAQSRIIDRFLARLTVSPIRNSRLVDVRFRSQDPALSANVTNALAKAYIEQNLEFKFLSSKEATDWLGEQLAEQRKKVEESETALQRYREKGDAIALEDRQNIVVQRLSDLNQAVTKARTDRIEKEAVYRQLEAIQTNKVALDTFPAILSNTFIQQLKSQLSDLQRQQAQMSERLGEKHPEMIKVVSAIQSTDAKLQAEIYKVVQSVKNEYLSALSQERTLAAALESPEGGCPRPQPHRNRVRRSRERSREQQADLPEPAPAHQGNEHLRGAQDQQRPNRGQGRGASDTGHPQEENEPAAGVPGRGDRRHRAGVLHGVPGPQPEVAR